MKKIFLCIVIAVVVVIAIFSSWYNKKAKNLQEIKSFNEEFESFLYKEITGSELTTVMNKALESNENNKVEKDSKGAYKDNGVDSIQILVKPMKQSKYLEDNEAYLMEAFEKAGMSSFTDNFGTDIFKSTKVEYHENGRISKIVFEVQN